MMISTATKKKKHKNIPTPPPPITLPLLIFFNYRNKSSAPKQQKKELVFRGCLEVPIAVGTKGGVLDSNKIYQNSLRLLGYPSARELSEIMVCVGLAQNFAALRALAIEGI